MLDGDDILLNSKEVAQILDCSPDTVNGAPRSLTKMNGDLASRFSARSALNSSPSNGWVPVVPFFVRRK